MAFFALYKELHDEHGTFQTAADERHIRAHYLNKPLVSSHNIRLARRFGDASRGIALHAECEHLSDAVGEKQGKSRVEKSEKVSVIHRLGAVYREKQVGIYVAEKLLGVLFRGNIRDRLEHELGYGRSREHSLTAQERAFYASRFEFVYQHIGGASRDLLYAFNTCFQIGQYRLRSVAFGHVITSMILYAEYHVICKKDSLCTELYIQAAYKGNARK